jgi:SAM-dependent methyltransferase
VDGDTLNLGCGEDYREAAWNVDISQDVAADEQVDLTQTPWPWQDDAFTTVLASHVLEHLDPVPWGEVERVLAPGGRLIIEYPIGHTRFEDVSHQQYWNYNTAAWIAGERKHGHERDTGLQLEGTDCEWTITPADPLLAWRTRYKLWRYGPGPWLGQVTGLFGHIRATYRLQPGGGETV